MEKPKFVYVTYIRSTPEKVWQALTNPEFTRRYFCGVSLESDWKPGSAWKMQIPDGRVTDSGEVLEIDPPRRLVRTWRNEFKPELRGETVSRCEFQLEMVGESVKLTVIHESETPGSKLIEAVSKGWPHIFASLKSFLETGEALEETRQWNDSGCKN